MPPAGKTSTGDDPLLMEIREGAERFRGWVASAFPGIDPKTCSAIDHALAEYPIPSDGTLPVGLASDAACAFGEVLREQLGGEWRISDLHGPVIAAPGGVAHGRLVPLAAIERKALHPREYSLEELAGSLRERLDAEEKISPWPGGTALDAFTPLQGKSNAEALEAAHAMAQDFRAQWAARLGSPVALSLMGVRQLDRFLRTHFIACFLEEGDLVRAGVFLGEVGRGLFGGSWDFTQGEEPDLAPLKFPELDYFPVGRIFKMMTERPDGEPLDEYLRLIPSARRELAGGGPPQA
ncbi:MAG: hypothetical protein JJU11_00605 [Candidatus Sumerlaeia bacterium]|nr:hypothetical protein [Candidatus Sumerlaeia bacterium]